MLRSTTIYNVGSVIPSILEVEEKLIEQENEALQLAEEKIHKAKLSGETLVEDTLKELPGIEEEERKKILDEVNIRTEELNEKEERELRELEKSIASDRKAALDFIMKRLIPQWNGSYPD